MDRTTFRNVLGAVAVGGVLLGTSNAALAGASAVAILNVQNFSISTDTGAPLVPSPLPGANFTPVSASNTSSASASHTSFGATGTISTTGAVLPIDVALQCVGPDCSGTQNNFVAEGANNPATQNFSRGDSAITGTSPIVGDVMASTVAEVESTVGGSVTAGSSGIADSSNEFSFILGGGATGVRFDFDANAATYAQLDQPGIIANAVNEYRIRIEDASGALVFEWTPNGVVGGITGAGAVEISDTQNLNGEAETLSTGTDGSPILSGTTSFAASISGLTQGVVYTVQISHESRVNIETNIPEPATIAMFGIGLLGLGLLLYRRREEELDV